MNQLFREKQKEEALKRMEDLQQRLQLNPKLLEYLRDGKVYYSYITGNGMVGSIDTIAYHPEYEKFVAAFEQDKNAFVYHAIESVNVFNHKTFHFLSLLFVSKYQEDWCMEGLDGGYIMALVINLETMEYEIGDIVIDSFRGVGNDYSVLIRKG